MKILLDTCTFLWLAQESLQEEVPPETRALLLRPDCSIFVSAVSAWEINTKFLLGKLELPDPAEIWIPKARHWLNAEALPISEADTFKLSTLPGLHRDPFDRMLICQAISHQLSICTPDPLIQAYPVSITWESTPP